MGLVRLRSVAWVAAACVGVACPVVTPGDRAFPCRADADCVTGYRCGSAGFCTDASSPDGGDTDGGSDPVPEPVCGFADLGRGTVGGAALVRFGTSRADAVSDAAALASGGFVVVGDLLVDEPELPVDAYALFLDASGEVERCARVASGTGGLIDRFRAVKGLQDGGVVAVGETEGDAGGGPGDGTDMLVVRYDADGAERWRTQLDFDTEAGTADVDVATGVTETPDGTLWIVGDTSGRVPGHPETPDLFGTVGVVLALDASGALVDARLLATGVSTRAAGAVARGSTVFVGQSRTLDAPDGPPVEAELEAVRVTLRDGRISAAREFVVRASGAQVAGATVVSVAATATHVGFAARLNEGVRVGDETVPGAAGGLVAWFDGTSTVTRVFGTAGGFDPGVLRVDGARWSVVGYVLGEAASEPLATGDGDAVGYAGLLDGTGPVTAWQLGGTGPDVAFVEVSRTGGTAVFGGSQSAIGGRAWGESDGFVWLRTAGD